MFLLDTDAVQRPPIPGLWSSSRLCAKPAASHLSGNRGRQLSIFRWRVSTYGLVDLALSHLSSAESAITALWISAGMVHMFSTGFSAHSHQRSKGSFSIRELV